jgi:hypothetical protein
LCFPCKTNRAGVTLQRHGQSNVNGENRCAGELLTLRGHTGGVGMMAFSPDGHRLLTGADYNMAHVWDVETGRELLTLHPAYYYADAAAFSPDGRRLVTGSTDGTAKVWEAPSPRQIDAWTASERAAGARGIGGSRRCAMTPTRSPRVTGRSGGETENRVTPWHGAPVASGTTATATPNPPGSSRRCGTAWRRCIGRCPSEPAQRRRERRGGHFPLRSRYLCGEYPLRRDRVMVDLGVFADQEVLEPLRVRVEQAHR